MNNSHRLNGAYVRLGMPQAKVTDAEQLIIMRDMHSRLTNLEDINERQKDSAGGQGASKVPKGKVSPH